MPKKIKILMAESRPEVLQEWKDSLCGVGFTSVGSLALKHSFYIYPAKDVEFHFTDFELGLYQLVDNHHFSLCFMGHHLYQNGSSVAAIVQLLDQKNPPHIVLTDGHGMAQIVDLTRSYVPVLPLIERGDMSISGKSFDANKSRIEETIQFTLMPNIAIRDRRQFKRKLKIDKPDYK